MMNHIYKFRLISMTMLCLLLSCTTPNPVEEAKVEMQKSTMPILTIQSV